MSQTHPFLIQMKYITAIIIILFTTNIFCQSKEDYHWFFGNDRDAVQEGIQGLHFNFNITPFNPKKNTNGIAFDQNNASISDVDGNLLFYTNGCAVSNYMHEIMENGDSLNSGEFFEIFWNNNCNRGYPGQQDIIILPDPKTEFGYYIIHKPVEYVPDEDPVIAIVDLAYSYVDLSDGLGKVTIKNKVFSSSRFLWSYLSSIRHSNGIDWWIIQPKEEGTQLYTFLLNEDGITLYDSLNFGIKPFGTNSSASGQAKFSPNGKIYAFFNSYDGLNIYDFDRETGEFSNLRILEFSDPNEAIFNGLEFSPNSELLYLTNLDTLFQVDLITTHLRDGLKVIDVYDGVLDPFHTSFAMCALGPDCRIYIRPLSSTNVFHVVNKPNERGTACNFVERGIRLPQGSSTGSFPNHPRFRVDDDEPCDPDISSFFGPDVLYRKELNVYPNPADEIVNIDNPLTSDGHLIVTDLSGKKMLPEIKVNSYDSRYQLDISSLATGKYIVEFKPLNAREKFYFNTVFLKL